MKYPVILEPSRDGGYAVHVPALPGCHTQGESVAEALANAKDAIRAYLRARDRLTRASKPTRARTYEVEVGS